MDPFWTQKDPMMQAFSPREANGYAYVGGDPVNLTDPAGTTIFEDAAGAVDDAWDGTANERDWVGDNAATLGKVAGGTLATAAIAGAGAAVGGVCLAAASRVGGYEAAPHCVRAGAYVASPALATGYWTANQAEGLR